MSETSQLDLFVADILDVAPKGDMDTMDKPVFALSTKPDLLPWRYEDQNIALEVMPSSAGRPTIFDKDLLMYCISQVVEGMNRGRTVSKRVKLTAYDFLRVTGRGTGGKDYEAMISAMQRLRGVTITTWHKKDTKRRTRAAEVVGLIEDGKIVEKDHLGRMVHVEIELSEWIFSAITNKQVLTYSPEYYRLRKPNERRMYELCRKFCGTQVMWEIGLEKLYGRFGTRSEMKEFRRTLREMVRDQRIPDYEIELDQDRDVLVVYHLGKRKQKAITGG